MLLNHLKPMNEFEKEVQRGLIHPAIRQYGCDPIWKWIAALGWLTVFILISIGFKN